MKQRSSVAMSVATKASFKIIIVGDISVGKTSLVMRYIKDVFNKEYKVTVGFQFYSKVVHNNNQDVTIQIWDTAGQQAFRAMIRSFYRSAAGVLFAFSMAKPQTLEGLEKWIDQVRDYSSPEVVKVLVGTKSDLVSGENKWLTAKADEFMRKHKMDFFTEVSSKTSQNVEQLFKRCVEVMHKKYDSNQQYHQLVSPSKSSFLLPDPQSLQPNNTYSQPKSPTKNKQNKKNSEGCC